MEFKTEDLVAKALDVMNNYELDGRELNIKQVSSFCLLYLVFMQHP